LCACCKTRRITEIALLPCHLAALPCEIITHAYYQSEDHEQELLQHDIGLDEHEVEEPELIVQPEQTDEAQEAFDGWAGLVDHLPPSPLELIKPTIQASPPVPNATLQPIRPEGIKPSQCRICKADFPSRSQLHKHLKAQHPSAIQTRHNLDIEAFWANANENDIPLIKSKATPSNEPGQGFRNWHYMTISVRLSMQGDDIMVCLDTGCSTSLIRKELLLLMCPNVVIHQLPTQQWVRGIGNQRVPKCHHRNFHPGHCEKEARDTAHGT
jgi:hypothetical protein